MAMQYINIKQSFKAPIENIFQELTDHVSFGKLLGANITCIKDGADSFKSGLGSVRKISVFPAPAFEEEVITFEPNKIMEYKVSKGSPIKNHIGRMVFTESAGMTHLDYTIQFEPKVAVPFLGKILKKAIETPILRGLKKLARKY